MKLTEGPTQQGFSKTQLFFLLVNLQKNPSHALQWNYMYEFILLFFFMLTYILDGTAMAHLNFLFSQTGAQR